jgi:V-type H+-transporting ATPase subunit a
MERILRFLKDEIVTSNPDVVLVNNKIDEFIANEAYELDTVEKELKDKYQQFVKFQENNVQLTGERDRAIEEIEVMKKAIDWLGHSVTGGDMSAPLLTAERRLNNVAGVVAEADKERFRRALWRASRGNTFVEFAQVPSEGGPKPDNLGQSVFVVYFQNSPDGGTQSAMTAKVMKVCAAFGSVRQYNWPRTSAEALERKSLLEEVRGDKIRALEAYQNFVADQCADLTAPAEYFKTDAKKTHTDMTPIMGNSQIEDWVLFCAQEKSIYATLNLCSGGMNLRVDCWYPASDEAKIKEILDKGNQQSPMQAALVKYDRFAGKHPPTALAVNDFTEPWQDVINTYGIPNYQSANPACITTVTFPFIFGMMYGDIGHGTLLTCIGLALCFGLSPKDKYGDKAVLYSARFLVLQLGLFATFAGFMYNDFFGMTSLQLFPSRFEDKTGSGAFTPVENFDSRNEGIDGSIGPYPFGVDWAWHGSANELLYINSLKMKLSVLMGVIQMTLGLCLRVSNALHDKSMTDLICECIPMFVFMICFFGFMDFMIVYKWTHVIEGPGTAGPPSIINSLICMAMFQQDAQPLWLGSGDFAHSLMTAAACAVPIMLFPKPFILRAQHNSKKPGADDEESGGHGHGHGGEFEFGEVFIHQIIETIEYVLGTVSHTASYLRIWALSLAHQQLSLVFYQKTLMMAFTAALDPIPGSIAIFCAFAAWFGVTSGVLLGMDVLECFLHTLRLHWVEFQSKFYKSDSGVLFEPFSIKNKIKDLNA